MKALNDYPRRVLLIACGMTPQVVTETLYGLRVASAAPFLVNEVKILTTTEGRDRVAGALLEGGHFEGLCLEHHIRDVHFSDADILVLRDASGQALKDIRTPEENAAAADSIAEVVRSLTSCDDVSLHVSLAGGRKTMSYYIGTALSFYGRAQDRLSHVLVSEGYETHPEFFYPTREPRVIATKGGQSLDTSQAKVTLAEIPFVRLRHTLPEHLLLEQTSFGEAVRWSNLDTNPPTLVIDMHKGQLIASGEPVAMDLKLLAFYAGFARRAAQGNSPIEVGDRHSLPLSESFMEEFAKLRGIDAASLEDLDRLYDVLSDEGIHPKTLRSLESGVNRKYLRPIVTGINNALDASLGSRVGHLYHVRFHGSDKEKGGGVSRYGLGLEAEKITLLDQRGMGSEGEVT